MKGVSQMDRRGFLRTLGLAAAAAVAPTKTYAFFGGILRPRPALEPVEWTPIYQYPTAHLYIVSASWSNGRDWGKTWYDRAGKIIKEERGTFPSVPSGDAYIYTSNWTTESSIVLT